MASKQNQFFADFIEKILVQKLDTDTKTLIDLNVIDKEHPYIYNKLEFEQYYKDWQSDVAEQHYREQEYYEWEDTEPEKADFYSEEDYIFALQTWGNDEPYTEEAGFEPELENFRYTDMSIYVVNPKYRYMFTKCNVHTDNMFGITLWLSPKCPSILHTDDNMEKLYKKFGA